MNRHSTKALALLASAAMIAPAAAGTCEPHWDVSIGNPGMSGFVGALAQFDGALHAGGAFTHAGGMEVNFIARWNHADNTWSALGVGANDWVRGMVVADIGSGAALYVGGHFNEIGGVSANHVARWDGTSWSALGDGFNDNVNAMAVVDHGDGPVIYAGGSFSMSGGTAVSNIARWDPSTASWLPLDIGTTGTIWGLGVWNDGTGEALYAGGSFDSAGGVSGTSRVAKWDGSAWSALGVGTTADNPGTSIQQVHAFASFEGELYVGGAFGEMSNTPDTQRIAKWDGSSWSSVGGGIPTGTGNIWITGWGLFDDGDGEALYAGGTFSTIGSISANRVAKWDGSSWSALGAGITGFNVVTLRSFDAGEGPDLYVGGPFQAAGGMTSNNIATWRGCAEPGVPDCPGDLTGSGSVGVPDLLELLACWGPVAPGCEAADLTGSGSVGVPDLLELLAQWGPCPQ